MVELWKQNFRGALIRGLLKDSFGGLFHGNLTFSQSGLFREREREVCFHYSNPHCTSDPNCTSQGWTYKHTSFLCTYFDPLSLPPNFRRIKQKEKDWNWNWSNKIWAAKKKWKKFPTKFFLVCGWVPFYS